MTSYTPELSRLWLCFTYLCDLQRFFHTLKYYHFFPLYERANLYFLFLP
ncbi:Hypothetical protein EUBREC_1633 [Agathobacter rectalis ATCC 33656]|uniref:Uncharacterized protein n=1 Tax=Agathobacter rectalis (strain ATCC 33656 / DSM 3377 / JCM 17463 / KCTC 5835 / VPI 0990) TaxID=515619 RepID=C4Z9F5_AGARV|nr:Hypothetical protein EUBREC_1633 [Agathobacter rectalis ATCC 33656]